MCKRFGWLFAFALAVAVFMGARPPAASAHGVLDQTLTGNPDCNATNFKGFVSSGGALRQEFVPAAGGLAAVELCINNTSGTPAVSVDIREGTAAAPGTVRASASANATAGGFQWVHVDLANVTATTPGVKLVIELNGSASFQWRSTCLAVFGSCTSIDADSYPAGVSGSGSPTRDFAFRTFAGQASGSPSGAADQKLTGDPACNATTLRGFTSSGGPLRQEFVPTATALAAVDLCVQIFDPATVAVNIRSGTVSAPGGVLAAKSTAVSGAGFQFVRLTLDAALPTTPGTKYVIELPSSATFQWRASCFAVGGACTTIDPDLYPAGDSSRTPPSDFGFRTIAAAPDTGGAPTGVADQKLTGDPNCNATVFRGFTSAVSPSRQEFVPTATGLAAIDLCIQTFAAETPVAINIREGTAAAPGTVLAGGTASIMGGGFGWQRVLFSSVVPTTPGMKYVIELPNTSAFQWRATCGEVLGSCLSVDADLYPPGVSTRGGTSDFGFRTIAGTPSGVTPTGTADQALSGDPACGETAFHGFVSSTGPLRQEFVSSANVRGADAVDLCLSFSGAGVAATVNLRTGSAASPGPIVATATATSTGSGFQWLRFDFANAAPTTPGLMYVIELPGSATFQWRGTCGQIQGACVTVDPDLYPPGGTNTAAIRDFAFRTIAGDPFLRRAIFVATDGVP